MWLGHIPRFGVARFRCKDCGDSRFVPFSCKRRMSCPSCDAKRAVVESGHALDACFSGAGGRSVLAKGARPLIAKIADTAPTGSLDEQGHGMFTYHLLKGLSADPTASAQSLFKYVSPRVQDDARRQNRVQTPVLAGASLTEPLLP